MVEYLVLASEAAAIEKKYGVSSFYKFYNIQAPSIIGVGDLAYTITYENYQYMNPMQFGRTGNDFNKSRFDKACIFIDDPTPSFSHYHHMSQHHPKRCLVIVDAFVVSNQQGKQYLIHLQSGERAFALAGFYETSLDDSGKPQIVFRLVTVLANDFLKGIGVAQMPVIVDTKDIPVWIKNEYVGRGIQSIFKNRHQDSLNGFPIKSVFPGPANWDQLRPAGDRLKPFTVKRNLMRTIR